MSDFSASSEGVHEIRAPGVLHRILLAFSCLLVFGGLYVGSRYNYLLFHTLAELFTIVIGWAMFVIAWNTRRFIQNNYLVLLGSAFFCVATLDLAHTLAFKGLGILSVQDANPATQLWIAARFMQAISLLLAPLMMRRRMIPEIVLSGFALLSGVLLLSIFVWQIFPDCYVEGSGLTPFKRISEYVICAILVGSIVTLVHRKDEFNPEVLRLLLWSIALTVISELTFTVYTEVTGPFNMLGHMLKILAFYLFYKAIIETGLVKPHALLLRKVMQSEERYRLLFNLSPDGIFSLDTKGRFIVVNPACEILTGYSNAELLQRAFMDVCAPDQVDKAIAHFENHIKHPDYAQIETAIIRKDGRRLEVWVVGKPLILDGKIVAIHCAARDISERKRFQSELERLVRERTAELQEMVEELEHFSYTITHDMRAPLRAMRGFGGILTDACGTCLSGERLTYLRNIMVSAGRMDQLITDALHYSSAVRQKLTLAKVDPHALMQGILASYPNLQPPSARIKIDGVIPPIYANEAGLTQCFSNILGNAVKFVEAGKVPEVRVWAEVRAEEQQPSSAPHATAEPRKMVRIWFEDNGIGIPAKAQENLFKMFQRVSKEYEGTGIGLALVRKVTEHMHGRVGVVSEPGKGSRFWLEFAMANCDSASDVQDRAVR